MKLFNINNWHGIFIKAKLILIFKFNFLIQKSAKSGFTGTCAIKYNNNTIKKYDVKIFYESH